MKIRYENATENDAYGIAYVSAHSWKETYSGLLPNEYLDNRIVDISNKIEKTKKFLKSFDGKYIVAKDNDKVVGILAFGPAKEEKYKEYGHLEAIYVLKDYQGIGIGKELFKNAVDGLKKMGYSKMYLECMVGNKTLDFYKKYAGIVELQIDFPINGVGTVRADVVLFNDLDKISLMLNKDKNY